MIKTAKPNKGGFKEFKRTLLEWTAVVLAENPNAKVNTLIAIPYNPYEPKPYSRWTMAGMLDLENESRGIEQEKSLPPPQGWHFPITECYPNIKCPATEDIIFKFL